MGSRPTPAPPSTDRRGQAGERLFSCPAPAAGLPYSLLGWWWAGHETACEGESIGNRPDRQWQIANDRKRPRFAVGMPVTGHPPRRSELMWSVWLWGVRRLASYSRGPVSGYGLRSRQGGTPHKYRLLPRSQGLKALNCPPNRGNSSIPSRCWLSRRPKTSGKYLFGLGIAAPKPLRLTRASAPRRNSKRSIR